MLGSYILVLVKRAEADAKAAEALPIVPTSSFQALQGAMLNMTAAQGTPNRGKGGKSINLIKFDYFFDFSPKWSWGLLDRLKILS